MNEAQQQIEDVSIEWIKKNENKFIVKFDRINIPIEMNKTYFESILKHLQN